MPLVFLTLRLYVNVKVVTWAKIACTPVACLWSKGSLVSNGIDIVCCLCCWMVDTQAHIDDIHVICGCLKDFLRSLKEPLVTHELWQNFVDASGQHCFILAASDTYVGCGGNVLVSVSVIIVRQAWLVLGSVTFLSWNHVCSVTWAHSARSSLWDRQNECHCKNQEGNGRLWKRCGLPSITLKCLHTAGSRHLNRRWALYNSHRVVRGHCWLMVNLPFANIINSWS